MAPSDGSPLGCGVPPQHDPSIARAAAILELLASLGPSSMACIVGAVSAARMIYNVSGTGAHCERGGGVRPSKPCALSSPTPLPQATAAATGDPLVAGKAQAAPKLLDSSQVQAGHPAAAVALVAGAGTGTSAQVT